MGSVGRSDAVLKAAMEVRRRVPTGTGLLLGALLVGVLAVVDYATGYEVSFSIFYLIPVLVVTWTSGLRWGVLIALVSAFTWGAVDLIGGHTYSSAWIPVWNAIAGLGFFCVGAVLLDMLGAALGRLTELALMDSLTGVHNVRSFYSQFEHEIARHARSGSPLTAAYLDLDRFKEVNDALGHAAGDDLLRAVAAALVESVREADIVGRLGGDEFAILMPDTGLDAARMALSRVHVAVTSQVRATAPSVAQAGATIGAVVHLDPPGSPDESIGLADTLMYEGKDAGRGVVRLAEWSRSGLEVR